MNEIKKNIVPSDYESASNRDPSLQILQNISKKLGSITTEIDPMSTDRNNLQSDISNLVSIPKPKTEEYLTINKFNNDLPIIKQGINNEIVITEDKEDSNTDNSSFSCEICSAKINNSDYLMLKLNCKHIYCLSCYEDYLTEKISTADVYKIKCANYNCNEILNETFIKNIIKNLNKEKASILMRKYNKFIERYKILSLKEPVKFCPFPDCEGYTIKNPNNNNVKCNYGHIFCFNCGALNGHQNKDCEMSSQNSKTFDEYRKQYVLKKCPKCKSDTEKNSGCNHITCIYCSYQWCWLCQDEYGKFHFTFGSCAGLQFADGNNIKEAKENAMITGDIYEDYFFGLKIPVNTFTNIFGYSLLPFLILTYLPYVLIFCLFAVICSIVVYLYEHWDDSNMDVNDINNNRG